MKLKEGKFLVPYNTEEDKREAQKLVNGLYGKYKEVVINVKEGNKAIIKCYNKIKK